jgi:hypothetical protein
MIGEQWETAGPATRLDFREVLIELLGHAPDPVMTLEEILGTMGEVETPDERGAAVCLACDKWGKCELEVAGSSMSDARRASLLLRLLIGQSSRAEECELRDSLKFQSEALRQRTRIAPRLAIKMLRGRRKFIRYLNTLIGVAGMGGGAFCSYVCALCSNTNLGLHDLLSEKKCYTCCIKCALESQKVFKACVRYGACDRPDLDGEMFDWQYATHMLGRFEHEVFADQDDLKSRTDYDKNLPVRNGMYYTKKEFDTEYEKELVLEGERFGYICAKAVKTTGQAYHNLTEMALTKIPTGSIGANGINEHAAAEIDKAYLNKKLAIIYLTKGEEEAIKFSETHARSGWMWKLEISKLRNLVPGTLGFYLSSARVSAYGEARFLGGLKDVPLMWSEARKEQDNHRFSGWQEFGYVACRDYKNYNICHKHERMQLFYRSARLMAVKLGQLELAADFEHMEKCLDDVGVYIDGIYNKWEYGLQSGWGHTMLFHCVHNACAGRVAARMVKQMVGWHRYVASHQGDDSREVWSNAVAGPLAQAILDAGGQVGQKEKQHFANDRGSWAEFLRVWYKGGVTRGSPLRIIGGLVSSDTQHSTHEGGVESIRAIVDITNDVWRRQGGSFGWRQSDMTAVLEYWATSNSEFSERGATDWRVLFSERFGLASAPFPELRWSCLGGKITRKLRHRVDIGPYMLKRSRRNLAAVGRAPGVANYAREYAQDMIASGVEHSTDVSGVSINYAPVVGSATIEIENDQMLACAANEIVDRCLSGKLGWTDRDEFSMQMTVNHLFGGSESVARAYVQDHDSISVSGSAKLRENVKKGLLLLAGKTSIEKPKLRQNLVCAKKYWPHVETYLQGRDLSQSVQCWLGFHVARVAIERGEWI